MTQLPDPSMSHRHSGELTVLLVRERGQAVDDGALRLMPHCHTPVNVIASGSPQDDGQTTRSTSTERSRVMHPSHGSAFT
jgi:hypothetical protein